MLGHQQQTAIEQHLGCLGSKDASSPLGLAHLVADLTTHLVHIFSHYGTRCSHGTEIVWEIRKRCVRDVFSQDEKDSVGDGAKMTLGENV